MRLFLFIALAVCTLMAFGAEKTTEVFTLDHQMSQNCEKRIKENLRFEKGISKIDVSLKQNTITITYNPAKTDTAKIIEAFKKIGFNAFVYGQEPQVQPAPCCEPVPEACCEPAPEPCCEPVPACEPAPCCGAPQ